MLADSLAHNHFRKSIGRGAPFPVSYNFIPEPKRKTGFTVMTYKPGGLANTKTAMIADLEARKIKRASLAE